MLALDGAPWVAAMVRAKKVLVLTGGCSREKNDTHREVELARDLTCKWRVGRVAIEELRRETVNVEWERQLRVCSETRFEK